MKFEDGSSGDGSTDRGVSPVIAVILMVAITVIMAAVIGVYGLGFGDETQADAPRMAWEEETYFDDSGNLERLEIVHNGGGELEMDRVEVTIGGTNASTLGGSFYTAPSGSMTASDRFVFDWTVAGAPTNASGTEVRIVWYGPEGEETTTIHTYELPVESV